MIGLSTAWQSAKIDSGKELLDVILETGVEAVELDYRVTAPMFDEMRSSFKKGILKVLSIHNFFPLPEGLARDRASGDLFLLSSTDKEEREEAIKYTIKTIRLADDLEAKAVVLHLGKVEMEFDPRRFFELYNQKNVNSSEGREFIEKQKTLRKEKRGKFLDSVFFGLEKLNKEAEKRGILLGVENRYYFHEIPDGEEMGIILEKFEGSNIRYWHDVGHATVQEKLGFLNHKSLLESHRDYLVGCHLHDSTGYDDHFAPGAGEVNYVLVKSFITEDTIKIMEVHPKVSRKEIQEGFAFLKDNGIE